MEWIVALLVLLLLAFIVVKSIDRETARGLKRLAIVSAAAVGLLALLVSLSCVAT